MHAPLVLQEAASGRKSGRTHGTRKGFLSGVQPLMLRQLLLRLHLLLTIAALELGVLVLCQVDDKVVVAPAAVSACLALEFLVVLHDLVPPHGGAALEAEEADGALGGRLLQPLVLNLDVSY